MAATVLPFGLERLVRGVEARPELLCSVVVATAVVVCMRCSDVAFVEPAGWRHRGSLLWKGKNTST